MIIAAMCTIPARQESFRQVLYSILTGQTLPVDKFYIWLNGYKEIPPDLPKDSRLIVILEPSNPGPWKRYDIKGNIDYRDIVLTVDDDLIYPADFVETGVKALSQAGESASICFAGAFWDAVVPLDHLDFYIHRRWIPYTQELLVPTPVFVLMGGVVFHWGSNFQGNISTELEGFRFNDDLMASLSLQRRGIQIISMPKGNGWIAEHPDQNADHALWRTDRANRAATFHAMVNKLGFHTSPADLNLKAHQPVVLVLKIGELSPASLEKTRPFLPDLPLHTLEIIAGDISALTCRPLRNYFEHFVSIPEPGGRFEIVPGVRGWRQKGVERQGWAQVGQYLHWLEAALNIQKIALIHTKDEPGWLERKLNNWIAGFPVEKSLLVPAEN